MKKIILILLTVLLFGCAQLDNFWALIIGKTEGTTQTEFEFSVDSNDTISGWYVDGEFIDYNNSRAALSEPLKVSFNNPGIHTVMVITENGAEDSVRINISDVETIFRVTAYERDETTDLNLHYPILTYDEIDYNIESEQGPYTISFTETNRIISLIIDVDNYASFYFTNENMIIIENIDPNNMSIEEFNQMLTFLYPEPEPEIPEYSETRFNLSGYQRAATDLLWVYSDHVSINGENTLFGDLNPVYNEDIRTLVLGISVDVSDFFLFMSENCQNFFGFSEMDMTYEQFLILSDVIRRYPEETIWELSEEYNS